MFHMDELRHLVAFVRAELPNIVLPRLGIGYFVLVPRLASNQHQPARLRVCVRFKDVNS